MKILLSNVLRVSGSVNANHYYYVVILVPDFYYASPKNISLIQALQRPALIIFVDQSEWFLKDQYLYTYIHRQIVAHHSMQLQLTALSFGCSLYLQTFCWYQKWLGIVHGVSQQVMQKVSSRHFRHPYAPGHSLEYPVSVQFQHAS